jgi:hypothetical protein
MNPQNALDTVTLIATAGAATLIIVQMVVAFLGVETPRAKVGTAILTSSVLTVAYAFSNALLVPANTFILIIAAITIAATGAGLHTAASAAVTNKPTP